MKPLTVRTMLTADSQQVSEVMTASIAALQLYRADVRAYLRSLYTPAALAERLLKGTLIKVAEVPTDRPPWRPSIVGVACMAGQQVFGMHVAPAHQRTGVGTRLLEALEATQPVGALIWLEANLEALAFYERLGYRLVTQQIAQRPPYFEYGGMEKLLR